MGDPEVTGGVEGREVRRLQAGSSGDEDPASRFSPSARCPHLGGPEGGRRGGRLLRLFAQCTIVLYQEKRGEGRVFWAER